MNRKNDPKFLRAYERGMLRSAFASVIWGALAVRRKTEALTYKEFAKRVGASKHEVSRWFNGDPNWTINTIANIAHALDIDLRIEAFDRKTGRAFARSDGPIQYAPANSAIATSGVVPEPVKVTRKPSDSVVVKADIASSKRVA